MVSTNDQGKESPAKDCRFPHFLATLYNSKPKLIVDRSRYSALRWKHKQVWRNILSNLSTTVNCRVFKFLATWQCRQSSTAVAAKSAGIVIAHRQFATLINKLHAFLSVVCSGRNRPFGPIFQIGSRNAASLALGLSRPAITKPMMG